MPCFPALPKKLATRLFAGEYIDFTELPPAKGCCRPPSHELEGKVVLIQATDLMATKKLIPDLSTWVQCFAMYTAAIATKQLERVPDMMAYMAFIAKCSTKFYWPAVMVYDQNFREQAADEGIISWAKADPSLYAQTFTANMAISAEGWCKHCHSVDHTSANCPSQPASSTLPEKRAAPASATAQPSKRSKIICKKYNKYDGDCNFGSTCKFRHICSTCKKGEHPATKCTEPAPKETN